MLIIKSIHVCIFFLSFITLFFFLSHNTFAVTTTIVDAPSAITNEPFTVTVSIIGAGEGTNYLRLDLFKEGSTNYFGETFNGNSWFGGSDAKSYFPITIIKEATWSGVVQGRLGKPSGSEYSGPTVYKIRIRRYTNSGNYSADEANGSSRSIEINSPLPTPTAQIPTPTSTPKPSSTPTTKPLPSLTSKPPPTQKITVQQNLSNALPSATTVIVSSATINILQNAKNSIATNDSRLSSVAGELTTEDSLPSPSVAVKASQQNKANIAPIALSLAGISFLLSALFFVLRKNVL